MNINLICSILSTQEPKLIRLILPHLKNFAIGPDKNQCIKAILSSRFPAGIEEIKDLIEPWVASAQGEEYNQRIQAVLASRCSIAVEPILHRLKLYLTSQGMEQAKIRLDQFFSSCALAQSVILEFTVDAMESPFNPATMLPPSSFYNNEAQPKQEELKQEGLKLEGLKLEELKLEELKLEELKLEELKLEELKLEELKLEELKLEELKQEESTKQSKKQTLDAMKWNNGFRFYEVVPTIIINAMSLGDSDDNCSFKKPKSKKPLNRLLNQTDSKPLPEEEKPRKKLKQSQENYVNNTKKNVSASSYTDTYGLSYFEDNPCLEDLYCDETLEWPRRP